MKLPVGNTMCKFFLQFVLSCVFAFLVGSSMWLIRELLAFPELIKIIPFILDYYSFMLVVMLLGLPMGSLLGIWIANTCLSRASRFSIRGAALGFAFSFLGALLIVVAVAMDLEAGLPAREVSMFVRLLRSDLSAVLLLISAGLWATIGYNLGLGSEKRHLEEHVTP